MTMEGICHCECSKCAEGDHCDNSDTGCLVTTGPDLVDPLANVSEAEKRALQKAMQAELGKEMAPTELDW